MKKFLLFVIMIFGCLNTTAQEEGYTLVSVAKKNWVGANISDLGVGFNHSDYFEIVEDGLAITIPLKQVDPWSIYVPVLTRFSLEEGHNYVVRLTLKVPSDGIYSIGMGNWDTSWSTYQAPAKTKEGFQIIDVEYPEYKGYADGNGFVLFGCGWVVGTTILNEIEILEKRNSTDILSLKTAQSTNNAIYNLAGQKVSAGYKSIVIRNGKKFIIK